MKETIGIIGSGLIGRAWATVFARAGHAVRMYDSDRNAARNAIGLIAQGLEDLQRAGLLSDTPANISSKVTIHDTIEDTLNGVLYVQENTLEDDRIKREVFAQMDAAAAPETILASSTSTIPTSGFAGHLKGKARCIVAHPVNPPHVVPIVEVSPAPFTDAKVIERTMKLHESVGQVPVLVKKELQGFILNRLQGALLHEAFRLVEDGYISVEDLDKTIKDGLGLRWSFMGPFETIDLNAPGGVTDYCERFGERYYEMATSPQSQPRRWPSALVQAIHAERRKTLPADARAARSAWRDRRLMALMAHKQKAEK
jgi:3-hydroxyacyl-CoA dehydrogenase